VIVQEVASPALYWPADEVGSPGDLSLHYTFCHIPSICFGLNPLRSGRDGLGCLGNLLEGLQEVVWAANLVGWAH
jgi:hypothetical protein